jgi:DegV family protein with EDD domain
MSRRVKVVTDSTADIPEPIRKELDIEMVPLKVHLEGETFLDGITLRPEEFYEKLAQANELSTTSQPSPNEFVEAYRKAAGEDKHDILSIHLSAALSGTYQSAVLAKSMLEDELKIDVFDGKKASYATGMMVVAAAEAAKAGKSLEECRKIAESFRREMRVYFMVDTLKYLQKGGRIGKASALLGSVLNIKPILKLDEDGEVAPDEKVRGKKKAMNRMYEKLQQYAGDEPVWVGLLHAQSEGETASISATLKEKLNISRLDVVELGPVIGTHAGPGTIGVAVMKESAIA